MDKRVTSGEYRHMINYQAGPVTKKALRFAMAASGMNQRELVEYGIAAAIKKYAPEYVDDVRKEMGE